MGNDATHAGLAVVSRFWAISRTNASLNREAQFWAYVDVFRYLALLCALCAPFAFSLQKPKKGAKGAG